MSRALESALYVGTVMHARRSPRDNVFRYPVYMALIDLDELSCSTAACPSSAGTGAPSRASTTHDHIDIREVLAVNGIDLGAGGSDPGAHESARARLRLQPCLVLVVPPG